MDCCVTFADGGAERDAALLRASQVSGVKLVILERTTQHPAAISQKKYKPIEESFGWMTTGILRKVKLRGLERVRWLFSFAAVVYNLYRLQWLQVQTTPAALSIRQVR